MLPSPPLPPPTPESHPSNEPLLFALVNGLCEVGVVVHDGGVCALSRLRPLRLVGVVGPFVAEHVPDEEDQGAEDGEDHHSDDAWRRQGRWQVQQISYLPPRPPPPHGSPRYCRLPRKHRTNFQT